MDQRHYRDMAIFELIAARDKYLERLDLIHKMLEQFYARQEELN